MKRKNVYKLPAKLWTGFIDGRIDLDFFQGAYGVEYGRLYKSRRAARANYEDVRQVEVREVRGKQ